MLIALLGAEVDLSTLYALVILIFFDVVEEDPSQESEGVVARVTPQPTMNERGASQLSTTSKTGPPPRKLHLADLVQTIRVYVKRHYPTLY